MSMWISTPMLRIKCDLMCLICTLLQMLVVSQRQEYSKHKKRFCSHLACSLCLNICTNHLF